MWSVSAIRNSLSSILSVLYTYSQESRDTLPDKVKLCDLIVVSPHDHHFITTGPLILLPRPLHSPHLRYPDCQSPQHLRQHR
jgi:hypothetical protein